MFGSSEHRTYALNLTPTSEQKTAESVSPVAATPRLWEVSVGYRWFRSQRHYTGSTEQTHREQEGSAVVNNNHLIDLVLSRRLFERWRVQLGLPVFIASRWFPDRQAGVVVGRNVTRSAGIGDLRISASRWMFEESPAGNLAVGFGVKLPTGDSDKTDDRGGTNRSVDQSIQPGDGGVGLLMTLEAFRSAPLGSTWYASGSYLANPRGNNGVETGRSRSSESLMSVPDQYLARTGILLPIPYLRASAVGAGLRLEGIPVEDLLGPSDAFRRPGLVASVEPSLILGNDRFLFSISAPVAFHRERQRSVPDRQDPGRHGDAAFADYSLLISQSFRF
jgi:hypothetical protein